MERSIVVGVLAARLAGETDVVAGYLFGSVARGDAGPASDIDVGLLLRVDPEPTLGSLRLDLEGDLEQLLARPVQLVILNFAPVDLIHRVLRDGLLVHESDRAARVRFEVQRRNEYFDLQPILRRYRRLPEMAR